MEVWDQGVGIPAAEHENIFEAFHRGEDSASHKPEDAGVGLGLAIFERTAGLLGLTLDLRSVPGRGSLFTVSVPVRAITRNERAAPISVSRAARRYKGVSLTQRLLCVDDDPRILEGLVTLLDGWGCVGAAASDHAGARALIASGPVDVAIVDYQLERSGGGPTGLDLIANLRVSWPSAIVALVTADPSPAIAKNALKLGAVVLRKPVDPARLRELIAQPAVAAE